VMRPTLKIGGKVITSGGALPNPLPVTLVVRLTANAAQTAGARAGLATVRPDGTFEFTGVLPGQYRLGTSGEPQGWRTTTTRQGDRELMDVPFQIDDDMTGIELVMSDHRSQISGRLTDASGGPAAGYFVVAFSADRGMWLPQSRRMKSVRPDTDGNFHFDDLPAGDYYLAALTDADASDWQTPAALAEIVNAAVKVSLGDGERKTQSIQIRR
jgi:carboxypeptidase family protein